MDIESRIVNDQEFIELIKAAQTGDEKAKTIIFEENTGLIYMVLKRFKDSGKEEEDLFQIGAEGLIKAINKFKPCLNYRFSTYAVPLIIGEIKRYCRDDNGVHISRKIKEDARIISKVRQRNEMTDNNNESVEMLTQKTGLSREDVILAISSSGSLVSLSQEKWEDSTETVENTVFVENTEEELLIKKMTVQSLLKELNQEEADFVRMRFFKNYTQTQIAKIMGTNQVAVSRYEKRILNKLRVYL